MQVVALAGGMATRIGGIAKCLQPVRGKPFASYWLKQYADCELLFLLGHRAEEVEAGVRTLRPDAKFFVSEPCGTGAALKAAEGLLASTFVLVNADTYVHMPVRMLPGLAIGSMAVAYGPRPNVFCHKRTVCSVGGTCCNYVDAGAILLRREAVESLVTPVLAPWLDTLAKEHALLAEYVDSYYDVGTPEGLDAFKEVAACL